MKRKMKRLLSVLLVCCLVVGLIPSTAFASDVVASGTCGPNLEWVLDSNGTLTISGTGRMDGWDVYSLSSIPWYRYQSKIKEVVVLKGVTSIGRMAFTRCNLEEISLPNTLLDIEDFAFDCTDLKDIVFPNSVRSVSGNMFYRCQHLDTVMLGDGIKDTNGALKFNDTLTTVIFGDEIETIPKETFYSCGNLKTVYFGKKISKIEDNAFFYCDNLKDIYYQGTEEEWKKMPTGSHGYSNPLPRATIHYNWNPSELCYSSITVVDSVTNKPISGVAIIDKMQNALVGYTDNEGITKLKATQKDFISPKRLVFKKDGYELFSCKYNELLSSNGTVEIPSQTVYLTPLGGELPPDFEKEAYIAQHINFIKNTLPAMHASHGFYENVWEYEDGKRLWACNTWEVIGDIGEIASLKFDDLAIFADYYDMFLSDLILSLTENELNDRLLTKATDVYQETYKNITDNIVTNMIVLVEGDTFYQKELDELLDQDGTYHKSYREIFADTKLLGSDLDKLLSGKEAEMDTSTQIIYNWFFGKAATDDSVFTKLFTGIDEGLGAVNTLLDVYTDEVNLITDVCDAYILTESATAVNKEVFQILFDAADELGKINSGYAAKFRRDIEKYYKAAMDEKEALLYILKDAEFKTLNLIYDRALRDTIKKAAYKYISSTLKVSIGELKLLVAFYNSTYKLLDLLTRNGKTTEQYAIMAYIAPVEQALSNVVWQRGLNLLQSQSYENAQSFDLAYHLLSETNKYLYDAAYKFEELRYDFEGTKTGDLEYATQYKNLWNTMKCHNAVLHSNSKYISVQCPVDVFLYDAEGNTVLAIVDEKITTYTDDAVTVLTCNEKKAIIYPADVEYSISITPRGEGVMDYSVSEVTGVEQMRQVSFYDLPLEEGNAYTGKVPCEFDIAADEYSLENGGKEVEYDYDSKSLEAQKCLQGNHAFGDWIKRADATAESNGYSERTCTACGFTEKNVVLYEKMEQVSSATSLTYTSLPQQGYTGTPSSAYTGEYEIHYSGRNSTVYDSDDAPADAGDYTVTIKIPEDDIKYTGSVSLDFTIAKAAQAAPSAPELSQKTSGSVTLKAIPESERGTAAQYSRDGVTWQDSPVFDGLSAAAEYRFTARYAGTKNYEASPASEALSVTTGGGSTGETPSVPPASGDAGTNDPPAEWENPYTDVSEGAWYYGAVRYVTEQGLMNGHGNGKFGPDEKISRGQFAQILYNKEGKPAAAAGSGFTDVPKDQWYYNAVMWAAGSGVVSGYGNGKYGPNDPITREQLAVMLWRYAGKPEAGGSLGRFTDEGKASAYARPALAWAVENGIINGKGNGILDPGGKATRGEAAQMVRQFCEGKLRNNEK